MCDTTPTCNKGHAHTMVAMWNHARYSTGVFNPA